MKKASVALALLLGLILTASGCTPAVQSQKGDNFAVKSSLTLSQTMGKLADSSEYVKLFTSSDTIVSEASELSAMDLSNPSRAQIITLPEQSLSQLMDQLAQAASLPQDQTVRGLLARRLAASAPNVINGQAGATWLATTSVLTVSETFSRIDMTDITYVILYYEGAPAATLTVLMPDGDFIQASTTYVKTETLESAQLIAQLVSAFPEASGLDTSAIQTRELTQDDLDTLLA